MDRYIICIPYTSHIVYSSYQSCSTLLEESMVFLNWLWASCCPVWSEQDYWAEVVLWTVMLEGQRALCNAAWFDNVWHGWQVLGRLACQVSFSRKWETWFKDFKSIKSYNCRMLKGALALRRAMPAKHWRIAATCQTLSYDSMILWHVMTSCYRAVGYVGCEVRCSDMFGALVKIS